MPLNKLENFLKNVEGRILYVSPADLDSTDSILNQGNSQTKPFKTLQRALIEAARFSYNVGRNNDTVEKTTILLMPGEHEIDNRPGFQIEDNGGVFKFRKPDGTLVSNDDELSLELESNFDINQENNILRKFNSVNGGVIVPRGTSIVGLDLRKTKIRPKYIPNPTDDDVPYSAIFRITGACYFWQFSIFDGDEFGKVYTDNKVFDVSNQSSPTFSHHKLTCFEYADGVNEVGSTGLTDLDMYYYKLSRAYNAASNRNIDEKFLQDGTGTGLDGFAKQRPEWEIVGAFTSDPLVITKIQSGTLPGVPTNRVTVTTQGPHNLSVGTPIKIKGVSRSEYNISTKVSATDPVLDNKFTYTLPDFPLDLETEPAVDGALVTIETDTVSGASPYIFNISLRSVWGMQGMHADGSKASGFRSMVVAQFTGVSLQKDDRAFVKYNISSRKYEGLSEDTVKGSTLSLQSSSTNTAQVYHLDSEAIYRKNWQTTHVKITNDAILQIVSVFAIGYTNHFFAKSGGDASITNSNSNFGQLALVSDGFKKDAFTKDDNAFITHIITPKAITTEEEDIEWLQFDATKTKAVGINTSLYLLGYNSKDIAPPSLTQGFRIGARNNDKLYLNINDTIYNADILMSDVSTSSARRSVDISSVEGITGVFKSNVNHNFSIGEKVIIIADDGDLPEKILEHRVYFIISGVTNGLTNKQFKLALSKSDADNGIAVKNTFIADASKLKVISRVTDKESGDVGHPVQFDSGTVTINGISETKGWFVLTNNSNVANGIYQGISGLSESETSTDISFVKRITDSRSLDDKIFKTRVSIPRETQNGKNIQNGFVLQESSQTGVRTDGDLTFGGTLTESDFAYERNPRFISSCTFNSGTGIITIETEKPHNLKDGDLVKIESIRDSSNTDGTFGKGYNVETTVTVENVGSQGVNNNNMKFSYSAPVTVSANPTTDFTIDKTQVSSASSLPRFTKKDTKANLYFFRNDVISEYDEGVETGVYHGYQLFADLAVPEEFTDSKYGQTVVDLYPQLDRDNSNDSPTSAKSFALRSPLGKVVTNDLQKSITKESVDKLLLEFGSAIRIKQNVDTPFIDNGTTGIIKLDRNHNLCGIATAVFQTDNNDGFTPGTYENVKIFEDANNTIWNGTLAKVTVAGGGAISSFEITNPGSGFDIGGFGYWDKSHIGGDAGDAKLGSASNVGLTNANLTSSHANLVVQITGDGTKPDAYFRTIGVTAPNRISIAKTTGDPDITSDQYVFIVGKALDVQYTVDSGPTGIVTFAVEMDGMTIPHGLSVGNRFQINDENDNNLETLIVEDIVSRRKFTAKTTKLTGISTGYVLKHGLSANDKDSGRDNENLSARGVPLYGLEEAKLNGDIDATTSTISITLFDSKVGGAIRFPQGSYVQIDDEILRIASPSSDVLTSISVIRGVFGTQATGHEGNSLVKKLSPIPLELHRQSILRASGHTFEYLGYGPGNYSTALPQVQVRTLTEREEFLSQAQERAAGSVVYTGMNDKGDFYIGNQKKSALTGEETTFDNPVPTVAGEDPARLSVVFDEVTVKERLVVEGGKSKNVLSQFDGPVTFTETTRFKKEVKIKDSTVSSGTNTGALVVDGGVGIGGKLNVKENSKFQDKLTVNGNIVANGNINGDTGTNISGMNNVTAAKFVGPLEGNVTGNVTGVSTGADAVRIDDSSSIAQKKLVFVDQNTSQGDYKSILIDNPTTGHNITYQPSSGNLTATKFVGPLEGNVTGVSTGTDKSKIITNNQPSAKNIVFVAANTVNGDYKSLQIDEDESLTFNPSANTLTCPTFAGNLEGNVTGNVSGSSGSCTGNSATADVATRVTINPHGKYGQEGEEGEDDPTKLQLVLTDKTNENNRLFTKNLLEYDSSANQLKCPGDIVAFFSSDERLKDNVTAINDPLTKVLSLGGYTFDWNENSAKEGTETGVIAQEVENLGLPGLVTTRDDGYKAVRYEKLVPLLIEAIKELSDKVDDLEQKLSDK